MNEYNCLLIGDLHCQSSNEEDTALIFERCRDVLQKSGIDNIIFLGDIFHNHDIVRQSVAHFFKKELTRLSDYCNTIYVMAGNHDGTSPHSVKNNAVRLVVEDLAHSDNFVIVDDEDYPEALSDGISLLIPFIGDHEKFLKIVNQKPYAINLFCHQTVKGAYYENGSLAPDGIDQNLIPQKNIISGHIHKSQTVGKVWYPGTPRALTASEYNETKGIWLFNTQSLERKLIPTDDIVKQFIRYDIIEGREYSIIDQVTWKHKDDIRICVTGSEAFYKDVLEKQGHLADKAKFIPNIRSNLDKKIDIESQGVNVVDALKYYVDSVYSVQNEMRPKIWKTLQEILPKTGSNISV